MTRAIIRRRRTLADGRRLVNVVCPVCDGRHWISADAGGCHVATQGHKPDYPARAVDR